MATASGLLLAYVAVSRSEALAIAVVTAAPVGWWVIKARGRAYLLVVVLLFIVPAWYAHVWLAAPAIASLGVFGGVAKSRPRLVDLVFLALFLVMAESWLVHRELAFSTKFALQGMLPFCYYIYSRLAITGQLLLRLRWVLLAAAGVAAMTVLVEAAHGSAIFVPPATYQWEGNATAVFRAGGIFGGAPTAATCLAMVTLASFALYVRRRRAVGVVLLILFCAIIVTLDRAGLLALAGGVVVFSLLLPYRRWGRVALVALAVAIPVYGVTSANTGTFHGVTQSKLVTAGILRESTLTVRVSQLFPMAIRLLHASPSDVLFGRGFDALNKPTGTLAAAVATEPLLVDSGGPNNQYLASLIEQGVLGLTLFLGWLGGSVWLGVRTALRLPANSERRALVAGLTAAVAGFMLAALGHDMLHNWTATSVAALITGMLVSVCSVQPQDGPVTPGRQRETLVGESTSGHAGRTLNRTRTRLTYS